MTALVLDAGALVAVERDDRAMMARLRVAEPVGRLLSSAAEPRRKRLLAALPVSAQFR